jgi:hypothetical protein
MKIRYKNLPKGQFSIRIPPNFGKKVPTDLVFIDGVVDVDEIFGKRLLHLDPNIYEEVNELIEPTPVPTEPLINKGMIERVETKTDAPVEVTTPTEAEKPKIKRGRPVKKEVEAPSSPEEIKEFAKTI